MSKKRKLIPALRFPEFVNEGEWKEQTLEDVLDYERPDNYIVTDTNYQSKGTPVLTANKSFILGYTNENFGIYNNLPTIIFDDFTVDSKFVDFPFKVKSSAIKILTPKKKDNLKFVYELISQIKFDAKEHKRYYISEYQKLQLSFPSIKEQKKIASCLSSLDEVIVAENQYLDLLKDHKKGLMQNLFPQEGKKVPKYRFKEFKNDGNWNLKEFSNYIKLYRGSSPRPIQNYLTQDKSGVNWIKIGDTKNAINSIIYKVEEKITLKGAQKSRKVKSGELILANSMSFGKTYELAIDGFIYDGWFVLREYENHYYKPFLLQLLNSDYMQRQYQKLSAGGIVQNISSEIVYKTMLFHTSLKEQQKIASCLSYLDALITAQTEKIEQLKLHKKGLMQGLFPKIND
ncbi:restriction endonuclease subunit S [Apibacter raozihei]|uniref:restriction endonuclease subunit S n=1 Tax=Apibacter raozihei TaxID=2500547 RepID=UPI000FE2A979|nr:restriction endonuclease subunit S [Apibacter raozihei]